MGTQIEGKARIWAKDFGERTAYSISVMTKTQEGERVYAYQPVRFRKGESVENGTEINFRAFATVSIGKEKNSVIWQITEYNLVGNEMASPSVDDSYSKLTNDDIPF